MNKDINTTFMALVPILRMNGEKVASIEAVHDWYKGMYVERDGKHREYMKEVAEITFDNGHRIYADIDCDSNLAACFDVLGAILDLKPRSEVIERIERGVYPTVQPNHNAEVSKKEIIHCKDCAHWKLQIGNVKGDGLGSCDFHNVNLVTGEGFCYWADKRGDSE